MVPAGLLGAIAADRVACLDEVIGDAAVIAFIHLIWSLLGVMFDGMIEASMELPCHLGFSSTGRKTTNVFVGHLSHSQAPI